MRHARCGSLASGPILPDVEVEFWKCSIPRPEIFESFALHEDQYTSMPSSRGTPKAIRDVNVEDHADDRAVTQQGDSALKAAERNLHYLYDPKNSPSQPGRFRTRALLRSLRYVSIFIFWRLVRWAKYVAVGSLIAAVSATALGGAVTGVGWIAAPPTIAASIVSACVWQAGKYGARKLNKRWKKEGGDEEEEAREVALEQSPLRKEGTFGQETGPQAVPW